MEFGRIGTKSGMCLRLGQFGFALAALCLTVANVKENYPLSHISFFKISILLVMFWGFLQSIAHFICYRQQLILSPSYQGGTGAVDYVAMLLAFGATASTLFVTILLRSMAAEEHKNFCLVVL